MLLLLLLALAWRPLAAAEGPAPGPPQVIGSYASGCIAGAVQLPPDGPGFAAIRPTQSVFWGHPRTIAAVELLGREALVAGLPGIYVNDIAAARGGPIVSHGVLAHAGHQLGLEADIWFAMGPRPPPGADARNAIEVPSVVSANGRAVDPARWSPDHARLLRLAAELPEVDRIFVNPAIKRQLCETTTGARDWLRLIRPWYGHAAHFYIRFRCPEDQPACVTGPPVPSGDGCDATLDWWFEQLDRPPRPPGPAAPPKPPPAACRAILGLP